MDIAERLSNNSAESNNERHNRLEDTPVQQLSVDDLEFLIEYVDSWEEATFYQLEIIKRLLRK